MQCNTNVFVQLDFLLLLLLLPALCCCVCKVSSTPTVQRHFNSLRWVVVVNLALKSFVVIGPYLCALICSHFN
jgi:hypothetical protein